jgi:hypothetical protein
VLNRAYRPLVYNYQHLYPAHQKPSSAWSAILLKRDSLTTTMALANAMAVIVSLMFLTSKHLQFESESTCFCEQYHLSAFSYKFWTRVAIVFTCRFSTCRSSRSLITLNEKPRQRAVHCLTQTREPFQRLPSNASLHRIRKFNPCAKPCFRRRLIPPFRTPS